MLSHQNGFAVDLGSAAIRKVSCSVVICDDFNVAGDPLSTLSVSREHQAEA